MMKKISILFGVLFIITRICGSSVSAAMTGSIGDSAENPIGWNLEEGKPLVAAHQKYYKVYGTWRADKQNAIRIPTNVTAYLTLDNVMMDVSAASPVMIEANGKAFIHLSGENTIANHGQTKSFPAIHVPVGAALVIDADDDINDKLIAKIYDTGGAHNAAGVACIGGALDQSFGKITINGGHITATGAGPGASIGSGQISSLSSEMLEGEININGGRVTAVPVVFTGDGGGGAGIGSGGSITHGRVINDIRINITGGYVEAQGNNFGAGIGGGSHFGAGTVTITGGEIHVKASLCGAGIGSGRNNLATFRRPTYGHIIITGGKVYAVSNDWPAAIGGGNCSTGFIDSPGSLHPTDTYGGSITIGGDCYVEAINENEGAAIGAGSSANHEGSHLNGGVITINSGTVIATAKHGAAIGGGALYNLNESYGSGGPGIITVNGGTVIATNTETGAAIGGGRRGGNGKITINGGKIIAINNNIMADQRGAGIGGGYEGDGSEVIINGGDITASAIGSGFGELVYDGKNQDGKNWHGLYVGTIPKTGGTIQLRSGNLTVFDHSTPRPVKYLDANDSEVSDPAMVKVRVKDDAGFLKGAEIAIDNCKYYTGDNGYATFPVSKQNNAKFTVSLAEYNSGEIIIDITENALSLGTVILLKSQEDFINK